MYFCQEPSKKSSIEWSPKLTVCLMVDAILSGGGSDILGVFHHSTFISFLQGIMTNEDRDTILKGIDEIEKRIERGDFKWRADREDVHMNVEAALIDLVGEPAKKLHTARSRNDQVQFQTMEKNWNSDRGLRKGIVFCRCKFP